MGTFIAAAAQDNPLILEFERFRNQSQNTFMDFRRECNSRYAEFLKQSWEEFGANPEIPKPVEDIIPPVIYEKPQDESPSRDNEIQIDQVVNEPVFDPAPQPVEPVNVAPEPIGHNFKFVFYGTPMQVSADDGLRFSLNSLSRNDISGMWKRLSRGDYDRILVDCLGIRDEYRLCDWAYLQMLHVFSDAFLGSGNASALLTSWLFCQSGYKMRLGTDKNRLYMLFASRHLIYNLSYFTIDGEYFYPYQCDSERLDIANIKYPGEKSLSLLIKEQPVLAERCSEARVLEPASYDFEVTSKVNLNLLDFFTDYPSSCTDGNPLTRWAIYAQTPFDPSVRGMLYPVLEDYLKDRSEMEKVGILLNFVQTALKYEYDEKVWGEDRAFFAEESLFYPYCDCEDRSILFSRLVRDLLGLKVLLVYYPGHLATAVEIDEPVAGDCLTLNSERFTICDPTYIGAPVGKTMPGMDNSKASVILIK